MTPSTWGRILAIGVLTLLPGALRAQGGETAAYLRLMEGARPVGMGSAFTAVVDDVNAIFFNIAGLSAIPHYEATFTHFAELGFDRKANFLALTFPHHPGDSSWGFAYSRFTVDGIQLTSVDAQGRPIVDAVGNVVINGIEDDIEENALVTYSWKQTDQIRVGMGARVLHQSLVNVTGTGLGMDLGVLYQPTPEVRIGLAMKDMFESIRFSGDNSQKVPFKLNLGVAVRGWEQVVYALEFARVEGEDFEFRIGAEKWWQKRYGIRAGLKDGDFTFGVSAKYQAIQFDYAFKQEDLKDVSRLSLTYRW